MLTCFLEEENEKGFENKKMFLKMFFRGDAGKATWFRPTIFVLAAEIVAAMVRDSNNVQGIDIYNKEQMISLYADSTMLYLVAEEITIG